MSQVDTAYLDHNATTPPLPEVVAEMSRVSSEVWANPSSLHAPGREARVLLDDSRDRIGSALGVHPSRILFTSGATESNNLILRGLFGRGHSGPLVVSAAEHPSVLETARDLSKRAGSDLIILPLSRDGIVPIESIEASLEPPPGLISVLAACNVTGILQPILAIHDLCRSEGIPFHTDLSQAIGRVPIDLSSLEGAHVSCSGHKVHGPRGVGLAVVPEGSRIDPYLTGGHQEFSLRAGTENLPAIVGLAVALESATSRLEEYSQRAIEKRDEIFRRLQVIHPPSWMIGERMDRLPNTLSVCFPGIDGKTLLISLDLEGVHVSTGSACSSSDPGPAPVLLAMGLSRSEAMSVIRISLGRTTTDPEIEHAMRTFERVIPHLRRV